MGKKKIIKKSEEELLSEKEKVDKAITQDIKVKRKGITEGLVYIACSYNNTTMTLTDLQGNVLAWVTSGNLGFKGAKKATPFAAGKVAEVLFQKAEKIGVQKITILVKGIGGGRDSSIRSLAARGFNIVAIRDVTPMPHNGCRPRKARRI